MSHTALISEPESGRCSAAGAPPSQSFSGICDDCGEHTGHGYLLPYWNGWFVCPSCKARMQKEDAKFGIGDGR